MRPTTRLKLNWLKKRKAKYTNKINQAYFIVRRELTEFIKNYKGEPDVLIKYLAKCTETDNAETFIALLKEVIQEAKKCAKDEESIKAITLCSLICFKFHWLSKFTYKWTNVNIVCKKCGIIHRHNFLYTNKLCPYCGNIVLT